MYFVFTSFDLYPLQVWYEQYFFLELDSRDAYQLYYPNVFNEEYIFHID